LNVPDGMEVKTYTSYDNEYLIIKLENNGDADVGAYEVKAVYYDENGNTLSDNFTSGFNFKIGTEMVVALDMPQDSNYETITPAKIDLTFEVDSEYQTVVGADKLLLFTAKLINLSTVRWNLDSKIRDFVPYFYALSTEWKNWLKLLDL